MQQRPLVVFDGDDTLWFVEGLYDQARREAAAIAVAGGCDPVCWDEQQRAIDLANVSRYGVTKTRFPLSCVEAYERCAAEAGLPIDADVVAGIERAAAGVFSMVAPIADGAHEVLESLSQDFQIALLTKGDRDVQIERLRRSGLQSFFDAVRIVDEKRPEVFADVVHSMGVSPASSWSVGNSIPSDVNPALAVGMAAIWIDAHVWPHERRESAPGAGRFYVAGTLMDAELQIRARADEIATQQTARGRWDAEVATAAAERR